MRFVNNFHSWLRYSWKLLANRLTRDPNIVIHGNSFFILYINHFPYGTNEAFAYLSNGDFNGAFY